MKNMRLRNKQGATEELLEHPTIVIQGAEAHKGKWHELFGNTNPIHIEVGTGKGKFLTEMSQLHSTINYIGVEKYDSVIITALERIQVAEILNLKLLNEDVIKLTDFFAPAELARVYINFTDPWPKNRQEKHRLTYERFLKMYQQVLNANGEIYLKTDNQGLFEYSLHSFSKYGMLLSNVSLDLHNSGIAENVMTEYEEKFSAKGNRIYRCEAQFR